MALSCSSPKIPPLILKRSLLRRNRPPAYLSSEAVPGLALHRFGLAAVWAAPPSPHRSNKIPPFPSSTNGSRMGLAGTHSHVAPGWPVPYVVGEDGNMLVSPNLAVCMPHGENVWLVIPHASSAMDSIMGDYSCTSSRSSAWRSAQQMERTTATVSSTSRTGMSHVVIATMQQGDILFSSICPLLST